MTADHEAQRQAADSQATDAIAISRQMFEQMTVALRDARTFVRFETGHKPTADELSRVLTESLRDVSALAEAGYTVVKTEDVRWEYGYQLDGDPMIYAAPGDVALRVRDGRAARGKRDTTVLRRQVTAPGPWVPVPEGSAEEAGGE